MASLVHPDAFIAKAEYLRLSTDAVANLRAFLSDQLKARFLIERGMEAILDNQPDSIVLEGIAGMLIHDSVWGYANDAAHLAELQTIEPATHEGVFYSLLIAV